MTAAAATTATKTDDSGTFTAADLNFEDAWLPGISFDEHDDIIINNNDNTSRDNIQKNVHASLGVSSDIGSSFDSSPCPKRYKQQHEGSARTNRTFRHVHFPPHEFLETDHAPPVIPMLADDIIHSLWWKNPELRQMKRDTRCLMTAPPGVIEKDELLGLDRFTSERIAYKRRVIRLVLLAQLRQRIHPTTDNPDGFIRAVSRRCSRWPRSLSLTIGLQVFAELYRNREIDQLPPTIPEEPTMGKEAALRTKTLLKYPTNQERMSLMTKINNHGKRKRVER